MFILLRSKGTYEIINITVINITANILKICLLDSFFIILRRINKDIDIRLYKYVYFLNLYNVKIISLTIYVCVCV